MHVRSRLLSLVTALLVALSVLGAVPAAEAAVVKPIDLVKIHFDPPGRDDPNNRGYNREYIQIKNTSKASVNLTGWVLRDEGPQRFAFPKGTVIRAGATITIRSGTGKNSASTLYWGKASYIWNNTGDTARLYNPKNKLVEKCTYKGIAKLKGTVNC